MLPAPFHGRILTLDNIVLAKLMRFLNSSWNAAFTAFRTSRLTTHSGDA